MECCDTGTMLREISRLHIQLQRDQVCFCCQSTDLHCSILMDLEWHPQGTLSELADRLGLDKGWVSRAVDAMVKDGLLQKEPGQTDRRTVILSVTTAGEKRKGEIHAALNGLVNRVMSHIPEEDRSMVENALQLLLNAFREVTAESSTSCISP